MNFKKDLLLVDLETTGIEASRHEIIQLAAVLLDKRTLKEKKFFNSYVKPKAWERRDLESMQVNKIKHEWLKAAPALATVLKSFRRKFNPKQVILSNYGGIMDIEFMKAAFKELHMAWPYDYHYFNLWGPFYAYFAKKNLLKSQRDFAGFGINYCIKHFKIKPTGPHHDGLADCRMEAEILRRVMKELK